MAQIQQKFIANNAVSNAKLAQMATDTIKGNNTGGTANAADLTVAQVNAILPVFTSALNGLVPLSGGGTANFLRADGTWAAPSGSGSVTSVSVVSANGFAGSVATPTSTPAITISTSITGVIKGNGTAISAATAGTDYVIPSGSITGTATNITASSNSTLTTLSALSLPGSQVSGNISGNSANVTGTVAIANGGTGQVTANAGFNALSPMTTAGDIIYENATPVAARLAIGTTGQILTVVSGLPAWATPAASGITQLTGDVTAGPGSGSQAATLATVNSNVGSFGSATSVSTFTVNGKGLITAAGSTSIQIAESQVTGLAASLALYLPLTGGTMSGAINLGGFAPTNSTTPVNPNDLVNKSYVDNSVSAISWKTAALLATTASITLSGEQTIDGTLTSSSRVLVKNQSTTSQNGIYTSGSGAWVRTSDMNAWSEVPAAAVFIQEGTVNADLGFVCTAAPGGTIGTTAITFVQFSSAGAYSADGTTLQLVSGVFSIKNGGVGTAQLGSITDGITLDQSGSGSTLEVKTGGISNTQISASAAIAYSKLAALSTGQILVGNAGVPTATTLGGDTTINATGSITLNKIQGTSITGTTGTGNVVLSASPTLTGTIGAAAMTLSSTLVATGAISGSNLTAAGHASLDLQIANNLSDVASKSTTYNNISPMTTTGDIEYEASANTAARLPIGSTGNVLTVAGGIPSWAAPAAASVDNSTIKYNGSTQLEAIQPNEQRITLVSGDITNQYVDLAYAIFGSSASVNSAAVYVVGGPEQQKTVDYTVSLTGGAGGVTRIAFAGDLATGGNSALVSGDILVVDYQYLA